MDQDTTFPNILMLVSGELQNPHHRVYLPVLRTHVLYEYKYLSLNHFQHIPYSFEKVCYTSYHMFENLGTVLD